MHGRISMREKLDELLNLPPKFACLQGEAINGKGEALGNCFGFFDGTIRPICCFKKLQISL